MYKVKYSVFIDIPNFKKNFLVLIMIFSQEYVC